MNDGLLNYMGNERIMLLNYMKCELIDVIHTLQINNQNKWY